MDAREYVDIGISGTKEKRPAGVLSPQFFARVLCLSGKQF